MDETDLPGRNSERVAHGAAELGPLDPAVMVRVEPAEEPPPVLPTYRVRLLLHAEVERAQRLQARHRLITLR